MALPQQLKSARANNATTASTIDNVVGAIESALADILGFTIDVDITASPFSLNNAGQITKALVEQKATGPVGWRLRDTTSSKEVRICVNGTNLDIDENTGTEGTPIWTNRFRMAISTGALTGTAATSAAMGLCPQGDGDTSHFLNGNLAWTSPSAAATPAAVRVRHGSAQSIPTASATTLSFNTEDFDTDTMHNTVTNNSRLTVVTPGKYMIIGQITFASNATGIRAAYIIKNGATYVGRTTSPACTTVGSVTSIEVRTIVDLIAGDYVQLQAYQTSGGNLNVNTAAYYTPVFSAHKIG